MRPLIYIALCLLFALSSEATLVSRTANRIHHAAIKKSSKLARDLRSVLGNVLVDQPIIGPDAGNRVYCVASLPGNAGMPSSSTPFQNGGGNPVIVSSIMMPGSSSSSKPPTPTSTSTSTSGGTQSPTPSSAWNLVETRQGASFFDGWNFWSQAGEFSRCFVGSHLLIPFP